MKLILMLLLATPVYAQTHQCDLPIQTGTQVVTVGVPFTLGWCHNSKDDVGVNVSITGWKLIRNTDTVIDATPTVTATKNAAGLTGYSLSRSESVAGTTTYTIYAVNGATDGVKAGITFIVQAVPSMLAAPTNLRVVVP